MGLGGIALLKVCMETLSSGGTWCEVSLINLSPGTSNRIGWPGDRCWLWCGLPDLDRLIPVDDGRELGICQQGELHGEIGTVGNCEIIPEVTRIKWGWGWCS